MKVNTKCVSVDSCSVIENGSTWSRLKGQFLMLVLIVLCVPTIATASKERYVIDFGDSHIRGHKGEVTTVFLKKCLKEQYPWLDLKKSNISKVVLVAKSKKGKGSAQLRVGDRMTSMYQIKGSSRSFRDGRKSSFDHLVFKHPSGNSRGPWQMNLQGNLIVKKVVVEIENRKWPGHGRRWRSNW